MKFDVSLLNQDLHYVLDVSHSGYCENEADQNCSYTCDHDYNRCYRISSISISEPTKGALNYLAEALIPQCAKDAILKDKILAVLEKLHSQFNLTDLENYHWSASRDYYGDHIDYVRFTATVQAFLEKELESI
jgi:hypothetical protein